MSKPRFRVRDGLTNIYSNINTSQDVRTYNFWEYSAFYNYQQLDAAYRESPLARKIVDIPADDITREWRTFTCEDAEQLKIAEKDLSIPIHYNELIKLARLSGGSLMLMIIDGVDFAKPLDIRRIRKGAFRRVINFDRFEVTPSHENVTNVLSPHYLAPEFYMVNNGNQLIHHTHFLRLQGEWLPRRLNRMEWGWGDSTLRKVLSDLNDATMAREGAASLINKANIDVFKMPGFYDAVATGQDEEVLKAMQAYKMGLSNTNVAITDATSEFVRHSLAMGGLSDMVAELRNWLAASAGIPVTRFWGTQQTGIGNQQEGDMKLYYDSIRSQQNAYYSRELDYMDQVLAMSTLGFIPEDLEWEWNPLFQPNGQEQAQEDLYNAQADALRLEQGVPASSILRKLQVDNKYAISQKQIDSMQKLEEEQSHYDIDEQVQYAVQQFANETKAQENSGDEPGDEGDDLV